MMMRTSPHGNGLWLTATFLAALLSVVLGQGTVKGDWTDLRKDFGWSVFDKMGRPFNPVGNLQYCALRTITITWDRGISDYSERINKAFKDLRKMNPPGGTVKLQAARYNISNQIVMPSFTCFQGSGMAQTRLFVNDRAPTFRLAGTIRSLHTRCVSVMDMTIDGNMDNQLSRAVEELKRPFAGYGRYGFFTELTNYVYLRRVSVENHLGYGFDPHGSKKFWAYYLLLEECVARNNGLDGFTLDQTVYVGMHDCLGVNNHRHGTNIVTGTRYCRLSRNRMRNNGFKSGVGCNMMAQNNGQYGTRHLSFINNKLLNGRKSGFCLNDVHHVGMERNQISNQNPRPFCWHFVQTTNVNIRSSQCRTPSQTKRFRILPGAFYRVLQTARSVGVTKRSARVFTAIGTRLSFSG